MNPPEPLGRSFDWCDGALGVRLLGVLLGIFFLAMGANKLDWLADADLLIQRFHRWSQESSWPARWYLETIAIPGGPLFARLVPVAELAVGAALVTGIRPRLAATLALLMVLNFQFATDSFTDWSFLRDGTGLPVLGGLAALALASPVRRRSVLEAAPAVSTAAPAGAGGHQTR